MADIPAPEVVLSDLERVIPSIYEALEAATIYAGDYFVERGWEIDLYLAPALVRHMAKLRLKAAGQNAEDEDSFEVGALANNGLVLRSGRYRIRILKSNDGDLPAPGPSRARQAFYYQYPLMLPGQEDIDTLNLVLLWEVGPAYRLKNLSLACPKAGNTSKSSVEKHWIVPIPYPITAKSMESPLLAEPSDQTDLPITFNESEEEESKKKDG